MTPDRAGRRVAAVSALVALAACSPTGERADVPTPRFQLYAPVLDGAQPASSTVSEDVVVTRYDGLPRLVQVAGAGRDLCAILEPHRMADDTCEVRPDGVVVTSMEEMSGVGLSRGGTVLYWSTLVTEADPGLLDRAAAALRDAPAATLDEMGDLTAG